MRIKSNYYQKIEELLKQDYERVYTDEKDVVLFLKTKMFYYVKTDRIFRSLEIESDGYKFFFDVSDLEHKKAIMGVN